MTTVPRHVRSHIAIVLAILIAALALPALALADDAVPPDNGVASQYAPSTPSAGGAKPTKPDKSAASSAATGNPAPATAPASTDSGGSGNGGLILLIVLGVALLSTLGYMAWRRRNGSGPPRATAGTAGEGR